MIQLNSPIFLNVELSQSFVHEYPICSKTGKIIVMPYPNTDPDMLSGKYMKITAMNNTSYEQQMVEYQRRDKLLFYHGGMHGSCEFIRRALVGDIIAVAVVVNASVVVVVVVVVVVLFQ